MVIKFQQIFIQKLFIQKLQNYSTSHLKIYLSIYHIYLKLQQNMVIALHKSL